jgi:hypothetical protein
MLILNDMRITTPITVWDTFDKEKDEFVFNHIEDGWNDGEKPVPKFNSQNGWLKQEWRKSYAHLVECKVISLV